MRVKHRQDLEPWEGLIDEDDQGPLARSWARSVRLRHLRRARMGGPLWLAWLWWNRSDTGGPGRP